MKNWIKKNNLAIAATSIISALFLIIILQAACLHAITAEMNAAMLASEKWEDAYGSMMSKYFRAEFDKKMNERYIEEKIRKSYKLIKRFEALKELDPGMDDYQVMEGLFYINKWAPRFKIDFDVAATIAFMESRFDPTAVSLTDDYGLMQVNYDIWGPVFKLSESDLLDTETNVKVGLKILKIYLDRYGEHRYIEKYNGRKVYAVVHQQTMQKYFAKLRVY